MKDLFIRGVTGIIYVGVLISSLWFGPIALYALFLLLLVVALYEMQGILSHSKISSWLIAAPALWYVASVSEQFGFKDARLYYPIVLFIWFVSLLIRKSKTITEDLTSIGALYLYPTLSFYLIPQLLGSGPEWRPEILYATFFLIWANDTFAYLTGRLIGKRKLAPQISPNKTIEGLMGGVLLMLIIAANLHLIFPQQPPAVWIGFGVLIGLTGNTGDLFESWLKRRRGVKDSGTLLPGHGGVLDRLDSFIFSVPFIYVYWRIVDLF